MSVAAYSPAQPALAGSPTVRSWNSNYRLLNDRCPWPGPRPLRESDAQTGLLVGREDDRLAFRDVVDNHRLVFLSGRSGVGKSSLLNAGLVPQLRANRMHVITNSAWSSVSSGTHVGDYLGRALMASALAVSNSQQNQPDLPIPEELSHGDIEPRRFFGWFNQATNGRGVLVLDQFEELIRISDELTRQLLDFLARVSDSFSVRIVLSFRSEYLHVLRPLEVNAGSFNFYHYELGEVAEEFAIDVVEAPLRGRHASNVTIDSESALAIARRWTDARHATDSLGGQRQFIRPGLLHLQAFMWGLFDSASRSTSEGVNTVKIGSDELNTFDQELGINPTGDKAVYPPSVRTPDARFDHPRQFTAALRYTMERKLELCREAASQDNCFFHPGLTWGVFSVVGRIAPHLSSSGYKLLREVGELATRALGPSLDPLGNDVTWFDEENLSFVVHSLINTGDPDSIDIVEATIEQLLGLILERLQEAAQGTAHDNSSDGERRIRARRSALALACREVIAGTAAPSPNTSGVMLGEPALSALVEELRRYVIALRWLEAAALVRITSSGQNQTMVSLAHDGFGVPFVEWGTKLLSAPECTLSSLAASVGLSFVWESAEYASGTEWTFIANQRWRGCWISAPFRRLFFLNCDLRGTVFGGETRLEGVSFVNCIVDSVLLDGCTISSPHQVGASAAGLDTQATMDQGDLDVRREPPDVSFVVAERPWTVGPYPRWAHPSPPTQLVSPKGHGQHAYAREMPTGTPVSGSMEIRHGVEAGRYRVDLPTGGIHLVGGSIAAFTVRACEVETGGFVRLLSVRGSGLRIVNQRSGVWILESCALRHFELTPPGDSHTSADTNHHLHISTSAVVQAWISAGLSGHGSIIRSLVGQVWNQADDSTAQPDAAVFRLEARDRSTLTMCVGVTADETCDTVNEAALVVELRSNDAADPYRVVENAAERMLYID